MKLKNALLELHSIKRVKHELDDALKTNDVQLTSEISERLLILYSSLDIDNLINLIHEFKHPKE